MNDIEHQGILYGAFLSQYRMETDVTSLTQKINFIEYERGLKQQWGIYNHESAIKKLERLADLSVTGVFDDQIKKDKKNYQKLIRKV